jgi:hypothetical protein
MSDHDVAPDPIDKAYVQAEALLSDEAARAARRERILGAVAREPAGPAVASAPSKRSPAWRSGGWLAAACVAGLSLFVASQVYEPLPRQPQTAPKGPAALTPATQTRAAPTTPATGGKAASPAPRTPAPSEARQAAENAPRAAAPLPPPANVPAPPPPVPPIEPAPRAFPAASAASPAPPTIVTAERAAQAPAAADAGTLSADARDEVAEAQGGLAPPAARRASSSAFAAPPAAAPMSRFKSSPGLASDPAARLRAAAAAGRTAEVEALLDQGAPVDAPDANGDTALIKSVQADHPAAAAALRRRGASLDHRNHAGESARDIAMTKGDAELNQAIGPDQ